jgi:hypothetical protein
MSPRCFRSAFSPATLVFASLLASCGSYDPPVNPPTGGTGGSAQAGNSSMSGSGGQAGSAGAAAGSGGTGVSGGSGGAQAGSGGAAGSAGAGGSAPTVELPCPATVPTDTACGGDVVGTWAATSCPLTVTGEVNMAGLGLGCATAPITSGSLKVSGTWTAASDGTYMDSSKTTGEQVLELPASCLTVSGATTSCDRVARPFKDTLGYATATCVDNAETEGCTCTTTIDQQGGLAVVSKKSPDTGTYAVTGGSLVMTFEQVPTEYSYCVAATTMAMTVTTVGKTGTVMGTIVLEKQ